MSEPTRLLLVRHGQSIWNAQRRWQGSADPPLSEAGRAQALALAEAVSGEDVDAVVSSDLIRARETAEIVMAEFGLTGLTIEPRFRERDVGEVSGLTVEEIDARWPGLLDQWRAGTLLQMPGGEADITPRVTSALADLAADPPGQVVLVVTHGGVIGAIDRHFGIAYERIGNVTGRWYDVDVEGTLTPRGRLVVDKIADATTTTVVL
ncbi:MAG TPA: histidine phosphatase family protein [Acidimicrobiales bacterium]|nr:histidine phosphatase family protein [Acidimicrobiales bacterium]